MILIIFIKSNQPYQFIQILIVIYHQLLKKHQLILILSSLINCLYIPFKFRMLMLISPIQLLLYFQILPQVINYHV